MLSDSLLLLLGGGLFGTSVNLFFLPGEIVLGGVTGAATVVNILAGVPVGVMIILINLPLLLAAWIFLGRGFVLRALAGVAVTGAASDILTFLPVSTADPILCAILGGVTMGAGCGLMFSRDYTTGGTDIVVWLIRLRLRRLSTGVLITIIDSAVVLCSGILLGSLDGIFYSAIALIFFTVSLDYVMRGSERGKLAFIFSEKSDEICSLISEELERGVSLLYGRGWYSARDRSAVVCAVRKNEARALSLLVERADPSAFVIFAEASEIRGLGFKGLKSGK
ncbi:MAG: YitT family protein [Clostridia bacterium]|nr:YitT family protein [Clostridia bacterium]